MPRLVITKGAGVGRDHAVGTECVVGRSPDVDFVLEDSMASRRHLRVARDGDGYVLTDLGSRNGTFLDGQRVQSGPLKDGSVIRVGATVIVFKQKELRDGSAPAAAKPAVVTPPVAAKAVAVPPALPAKPVPPANPVAPKPIRHIPGLDPDKGRFRR